MKKSTLTPFQQQIKDIIDVGVLKIEQLFIELERKFWLADYRQDIMELRLLEHCSCCHVNKLILADAKDGSLTKQEVEELIKYNNSL